MFQVTLSVVPRRRSSILVRGEAASRRTVDIHRELHAALNDCDLTRRGSHEPELRAKAQHALLRDCMERGRQLETVCFTHISTKQEIAIRVVEATVPHGRVARVHVDPEAVLRVDAAQNKRLTLK